MSTVVMKEIGPPGTVQILASLLDAVTVVAVADIHQRGPI